MRGEHIYYTEVDYGYHTLIRSEDMVSCTGNFMPEDTPESERKPVRQSANLGDRPNEEYCSPKLCLKCGINVERFGKSGVEIRVREDIYDPITDSMSYYYPLKKDMDEYWHPGGKCATQGTGFVMAIDVEPHILKESEVCSHLPDPEVKSKHKKAVAFRDDIDDRSDDILDIFDVYKDLRGEEDNWMHEHRKELTDIYTQYSDNAGKSKYETSLESLYYEDEEGNIVERDVGAKHGVVVEINDLTLIKKDEARVINYLVGGKYAKNGKGGNFIRLNGKWKATPSYGSLLYSHSKCLNKLYAAKKNIRPETFDRLISLVSYCYGYIWHTKAMRHLAHKKVEKNPRLSFSVEYRKLRKEQIKRKPKNHGPEEKPVVVPEKHNCSVYNHLVTEYEYEARAHEAMVMVVYA